MTNFNIENFGVPEWIYLIYTALYIWAAWHENGKPKKGKWDFKSELLGVTAFFGLLYFGGFFK